MFSRSEDSGLLIALLAGSGILSSLFTSIIFDGFGDSSIRGALVGGCVVSRTIVGAGPRVVARTGVVLGGMVDFSKILPSLSESTSFEVGLCPLSFDNKSARDALRLGVLGLGSLGDLSFVFGGSGVDGRLFLFLSNLNLNGDLDAGISGAGAPVVCWNRNDPEWNLENPTGRTSFFNGRALVTSCVTWVVTSSVPLMVS